MEEDHAGGSRWSHPRRWPLWAKVGLGIVVLWVLLVLGNVIQASLD
jgi:hypothetical protein